MADETKIEEMTHNDLGDALKERGLNVPASKADRIAALQGAIDADKAKEVEDARRVALTDDQRATEDAAAEVERRAALTDEERAAEDEAKKNPHKTAEQAGWAKNAGQKSTAPEKPVAMERPYLDAPRPFGIHIEGILVRFPKGRTPIKDHGELTADQVLKALKSDSYVADNGAEVVE